MLSRKPSLFLMASSSHGFASSAMRRVWSFSASFSISGSDEARGLSRKSLWPSSTSAIRLITRKVTLLFALSLSGPVRHKSNVSTDRPVQVRSALISGMSRPSASWSSLWRAVMTARLAFFVRKRCCRHSAMVSVIRKKRRHACSSSTRILLSSAVSGRLREVLTKTRITPSIATFPWVVRSDSAPCPVFARSILLSWLMIFSKSMKDACSSSGFTSSRLMRDSISLEE
mmetsp:Transcript_105606/g.251744  ORF Transcript_105606/g.251744 Transcript_105606/m.251744 type:complete len:229 (-) Transcript_105606:2429-3115(-)